LKDQLDDAIAHHEQIAEEIERASEDVVDTAPAENETALASETPGR
jgi:hypothetical protein